MASSNLLAAYLPMDRRWALLQDEELPQETVGAVLFADLGGFTQLGEELARRLGPWQGAEELNRQVSTCFGDLIEAIHSFRGAVVRFSGDALLAVFWGDGPSLARATAAARSLQQVMGRHAPLSLKIGLGRGPIRRRLVGDPAYGVHDLVSGPALREALEGMQAAAPGEIRGPGPVEPAHPCPWPDGTGHDLAPTLLRPWIPPDIYDRLTEGVASFVAELRQVIPLFARVDCSEEALGRYVPRVQEILAAHGTRLNGVEILDKGPLLVALFGAPVARGDDALRAAGAALALIQAGREEDPPIAQRIGLTMGPLYAGLVGSAARLVYTVYGDEMNVAARLMETAGSGEILATNRLCQTTARHYRCTPLGPLAVKGRSETTPIVRVEGPRAAPEAGGTGPLVGRRGELARFDAIIDGVLDKRSHVVLLEGEAGIGKSRLAAALVQRWRERGGRACVGQAQAMAQQQAYFAWNELLRHFFGLRGDEGDRARLEALVSNVDPALHPRLPLLGDILGLPIPESDLTRSFDARLRQASTQALVLRLLQACREPLLVVLEDVHWMDGPSWELTQAVVRGMTDRAVLFCLVSRPMEHPPAVLAGLATLPTFEKIPLGNFSPQEAVELAQARLEVPALPPTLATFLQSRGQGNPFFIEEILHTLQEEGILSREDHTVIVQGSLEEAELPDNVQGVVLARIDRLPEPVRLTLKVAAVIGRIFAYPVLRDVHPLPMQQQDFLHAHLEQLQAFDIVLAEMPAPELSYIFKHAITHEVAYSTLLFSQRRELHEQIAHYYERNNKGHLEPYYARLVYHYGRSGDESRQLRYARLAGQEAARRYANAEAIAFYGQALGILERQAPALQGDALDDNLAHRWQLLAEREALFSRTGQRERQQADVEALLGLAQELGRTDLYLESLYHRTHFLFVTSDYDRAQDAAEQLIALAQQAGNRPMEGRGWHYLGQIAYYRGYCEESRRYCQEALDLLQATDDEEGIASVLNTLGLASYGLSRYNQAQSYLERAGEIYHRLGNYAGEVQASGNIGLVLWDCGRYEQALERFYQVLALSRQIGQRYHETYTLNNLGDLQRYMGRYEEAVEHLGQALRLSREIQSFALEGECLNNLGRVFLAQGRFQIARTHLEQALEIRESLQEVGSTVMDLSFLARAYLGQGEIERALQASRQALGVLDAQDVAVDWPQQIHLNHYLVCQAAGLEQEAQTALEQAYRTMVALAEAMPPEGRRAFLEKVRVNREIAAAYRAG